MPPARLLVAALSLWLALPAQADRYRGQKRASTDYDAFGRYRPATYTLTRPYYIPVYGVAGRRPVFFPPQRLNPGTPKDNPPPRPFQGPGYLPPGPETTTMKIINRFNDDGDDRPIWGETSSSSSDGVVPTRPPRPPGMSEFPPLVHDVGSGATNSLASDSEVKESAPKVESLPSRATTASPIAGPSNCVWAILSCCSTASTRVPDSCFEQRGCPGPFWGSSPCDGEFAKSAIDAALNYYRS